METEEKSGGGIGRTVIAIVVLALAGYVLFHVVFGLIAAVAGFVVVVAAIIGIVWALRVLL
jgi:hypothetical protein